MNLINMQLSKYLFNRYNYNLDNCCNKILDNIYRIVNHL